MRKTRIGFHLLAIGIGCAPLLQAAAAAEPVSALVRVEPLAQHTLSETLTGYGVVTADTGGQVNVSLPRAGQVTYLALTAGETVRHGQTLFEFRTDASGGQNYKQALTAVKFASEEVNRTKRLFSEKLATVSQVDAARKALADAEASLQVQRRIGNGFGIARVAAPFDGVVMKVAVAQGDRIGAGVPVLTLARAGRLRVHLGIEPEDIAKVKVGMPVSIMPVFDTQGTVHAKVAEVHGTVNPQTRLVDVVVRFEGTGTGVLLPGMQVSGVIMVASKSDWAVPRSAVLRDSKGAYLFQIDGGKARRVDVSTGLESDGLVEVTGHFDSSLPVVVLGNYELKDAMAVRENSK
ncbi:MAG: efflux RND transporter periplasmic adaptor subunit [Acidiferrobacterales bacterium]